MINLCPSIFIGMDGIHSAGLGTWSFLFDNGIIWTGFHTFAAFDTFFLIDYSPAILHMNGILGTDLLTWVLQAALTAFCHQDSFLRAGIAGKFDNINQRWSIIRLRFICQLNVISVERRARKGSNFSIIAVAEGAINTEEARMKRKEWMAKRAEAGYGVTATNRIAAAVQKKTGMETRVCIPGHMQRGGSPSAYDRVLATEFGSYAAKLVEVERYGVTVAMVNNRVVANRLEDIAGKARNIPEGCELLTVARRMGVSLG